jgi:Domain of unknown function (DUF5122) beta-propeller
MSISAGLSVSTPLHTVDVQSDGRTVVAGTGPFALIRYNQDGSLDATFGNSDACSRAA